MTEENLSEEDTIQFFYESNFNDTYDPLSSKKLFIGGLSMTTSDEAFMEFFSQFGNVEDAVVMRDKHTGASRGFGFVTFTLDKSINRVLNEDLTLDGRKIDAKLAVPKEEIDLLPRKTKKIFVGAMSRNTTAEDQFGKVTESNLVMDVETGRSRCFGFVSFEHEEDVDVVCCQREHIVGGKKVDVKKAMPKRLLPRPNWHHKPTTSNTVPSSSVVDRNRRMDDNSPVDPTWVPTVNNVEANSLEGNPNQTLNPVSSISWPNHVSVDVNNNFINNHDNLNYKNNMFSIGMNNLNNVNVMNNDTMHQKMVNDFHDFHLSSNPNVNISEFGVDQNYEYAYILPTIWPRIEEISSSFLHLSVHQHPTLLVSLLTLILKSYIPNNRLNESFLEGVFLGLYFSVFPLLPPGTKISFSTIEGQRLIILECLVNDEVYITLINIKSLPIGLVADETPSLREIIPWSKKHGSPTEKEEYEEILLERLSQEYLNEKIDEIQVYLKAKYYQPYITAGDRMTIDALGELWWLPTISTLKCRLLEGVQFKSICHYYHSHPLHTKQKIFSTLIVNVGPYVTASEVVPYVDINTIPSISQ